MNKIISFFQGELSKRALTHRLIPIMIGGFSIFLIIARILFPYDPIYPYNWITSTISRLGIPHQNISGWVFFSAAYIWLGVLSLPLVPYTYKRFSSINKIGAKLLAICMLAPFISDILLGVIPNFLPQIFRIIHGINALFAFQCILFMAFLSLILMLNHQKQGKDNFSRKLMLVYFILLIYAVISSVLVLVFLERGPEGYFMYVPGTPFYASSPFWEWQGFILLLCLVITFSFLIPEKME